VGVSCLLAPLVMGVLLAGTVVAVGLGRPSPSPAALPATLSGSNHPAAPTFRNGVRHSAPGATVSTTTTTLTTSPANAVARMGALREPNALVTMRASITAAQLRAVQSIRGVVAVDVVDTGTVALQGAPAMTLGVDPGTFRNFTPAVTATADRLWQYLAAGSVASSFDMSRDRKLALGVQVPVAAAGTGAPSEQYLGAFISVGLPGVDLVVGRQLSGPLGLSPSTGVIVSAPKADPFVLHTALKEVTGGASVVLMRPGLALGSTSVSAGGSVASSAQLSTALTAALSRVGTPYIWGATGPKGFDCSGLVGWSFAAAGIDLPRTAAEQALAGPAVPLSQLQPGDLLFWAYDPGDPSFIDHVAIYLGRGQMIESPQTGETVHVIALQTGHLVGAVRINPAIAAKLGSPWRR
jgi:hypothetical protein